MRPHSLTYYCSTIIGALIIGIVVLGGDSAADELRFASAFTSSMVLQRDAPLVVTGRGPANCEVEVTLGAQQVNSQVDANGGWRVEFAPLPAGGPVTMTASDGSDNSVILEDILIGDVWVFSGQSNMQMGLQEADGGAEAIAAATSDMPIRVLSVPKATAKTPQSEIGAEWKHCTPQSLPKLSAVAWFFAHHLRQAPELQAVPLGLVDSSFGGTAIEGWTPEGTLPNIDKSQLSGSLFGIQAAHLYNRMIVPLTVYKVKGVVWYQGESNAGSPTVYAKLLQNMIAQWRRVWQQPELPFLIVELPAFEGRMKGLDFSWLREAQAEACRQTVNAWLAVTFDTTNGFDLHPREKDEIGRRLALLARGEVYGEDIVAQGPKFETAMAVNDQIVVTFDQTLETSDAAVRGFAIAGTDGEYRYADATIEGRQATLSASGVPSPVSVRYAWGAMPVANLIGVCGLPAAPFRTDDQPPQSHAFEPLPTFYRIEMQTYALETGRGGSVASLIVGGKQFLSNESDGGTSIPSMFGARNLAYSHLIGPRRFSLADSSASLELACDDSAMTWIVTNGGNDPIELHISLAAAVEVEVRGDQTSAELSRDGTKLTIDGIARVDGDRKLVANIPPHDTAQLHWTFSEPK
ncbi:MAG: hypothetical protein IT422_07585 [Pirellulaceae bacterium]|nr:hypothetical protein [Pirellulaceae bacterium]